MPSLKSRNMKRGNNKPINLKENNKSLLPVIFIKLLDGAKLSPNPTTTQTLSENIYRINNLALEFRCVWASTVNFVHKLM